MQYKKESSIICFGDTKQAALYFDRIFSVSFVIRELYHHPKFQSYFEKVLSGGILNEQVMKIPESETEKLIKEISTDDSVLNLLLIYENLLESNVQKVDPEFLNKIFGLIFSPIKLIFLTMELYSRKKRLNEFPKSAIEQYKHLSEINELEYGIDKFNRLWEILLDLVCVFYAEDIKVEELSDKIRRLYDRISEKWAGQCGQILLPSFSVINKEAIEKDVSLTLANISLIDTSKVKWEQILEYRKDIEARKKIRNLRLFLHTNYQGKNFAFIEDDLGKRLDEYYNTCKDWGFETLTSTISAIMDSEKLVPLIAGSTGATLFGGPVAGLAVGGGILIANISLNIAKGKHAFNKFKRDHELAYIIEAKERLEVSS